MALQTSGRSRGSITGELKAREITTDEQTDCRGNKKIKINPREFIIAELNTRDITMDDLVNQETYNK